MLAFSPAKRISRLARVGEERWSRSNVAVKGCSVSEGLWNVKYVVSFSGFPNRSMWMFSLLLRANVTGSQPAALISWITGITDSKSALSR